MKITVEKEEIQRKLADIQNIVDRKGTMPILNHFLLIADKKGSYIIATDLETAFKEPININIQTEGKICIPARKLLEIVREMEGEITIEAVDSQWIKVMSGKTLFRLSCLNAEEYPVWPSIEGKEEIDLDSKLLLEMIERSLYSAGEADTRYVLNSLLFHIRTDGTITVVGTDGHRLALSRKNISNMPKEDKQLIVSRKAISELKRFLAEEIKSVNISIGKNHILFKFGDTQFLTRLIEGSYPAYEQVIPNANTKTLFVDKNLLSKALRRVSIMSRDRSNAVKLDLESNRLVLSANNPDFGDATDEIEAEFSNKEAFTIAFNAKYILDALNVIKSDKVIFKLNEPLSPTLLLEEGNEDYKCVIMPMRI